MSNPIKSSGDFNVSILILFLVRSCNLKKWIYIYIGKLLKTPEDYNETCMRKVLNQLPVIFYHYMEIYSPQEKRL